MVMSVLYRLVLTLPPGHAPENAEVLQAHLALHVPHGWEEQGLPTGEFRCIVHCALPEVRAGIARAVRNVLPGIFVEECSVAEENWAEAWKEFFTPVKAGAHFLVLAPWMREERDALDAEAAGGKNARIPLIIEPKSAFGTGHHESTALCLEALSALYAEGRIGAGMRFLDLGTGTGILGLACAGLQLHGDGLDTDPCAVANALENRAANGISAQVFAVRLGDIAAAQDAYDLVLANILAGPLMEMAPAMAALSGKGDVPPLLVLSGILTPQADAVERAYLAAGFERPRRLLRGEWAALIFA
jgi:ribosomal protein L11 methyltransferase